MSMPLIEAGVKGRACKFYIPQYLWDAITCLCPIREVLLHVKRERVCVEKD